MKESSKIQDFVENTIFQRMITLNKIEIGSYLITGILLVLKSILGTWLILTIFISEQDTSLPLAHPFRNYLLMQWGNSIKIDVMIAVIFTLLNASVFILFLIPFRSSISHIVDRALLVLLLLVETFQYMGVIVLCSTIRNLIQGQNYVLGVINSLNFLAFIIWNSLFRSFYFTLSHGTKNYLARFPSSHNCLIQFLSLMITATFTFLASSTLLSSQKITMNILLLALRILAINYCLLKWHYPNFTIQCLYSLLQISEAACLLYNILREITQQSLLDQNFYICVTITTAFCFFGWKAYFIHEQQSLYFSTGKEIKQPSQAILFFKVLLELSGQVGMDNDTSLLFSSIRKQHQLHCANKQCYCKENIDSGDFAKDYIIEQLDNMRINFKNHPIILIQELNFRFKLFKTYPDVLTRLQKIKSRSSLCMIENFSLISLRTDLIEWMHDKNRISSTIDVETPLKLVEITKEMENIIKKDVEIKGKKWKYLSHGFCRTEELEDDTRSQIESIKKITEIHSQWIFRLKRSTLFHFLLLFYYKKVSFLNVNVEQVLKNLADGMKRVKQEELSSTKEFAKCLFHKRSCLIESLIDEDKMGIVTRSSKSVFDLFGYQQKKIIGINLNRLMPNFMAEQHDRILNEWVKSGTWRTVGKLKEIFCIHKEEYCFSALLYLKVVANQRGLFFITALFKKNESDYLILNPKQQIEGFGRKFQHVIGKNCRKIPIQLLVEEFPTNQIPNNFEYKTFTKTFYSIKHKQHLVTEFLQEKSHALRHGQSEKELAKRYQRKLASDSKAQHWQVRFDAKLYKMRQVRYYIILLNSARLIGSDSNETLSTIQNKKCDNILVGHGKMNEEEDSNYQSSNASSKSTVGGQQTKLYDDKTSSIISVGQRQNFTLSKLLSIFYSYIISPSQIRDSRLRSLSMSTVLLVLILTTIIAFTFTIYNQNLSEVSQYIKANADVNHNLQGVILMYSRVINFEEYKGDSQVIKRISTQALYDLYDFYSTTAHHLRDINAQRSEFHEKRLYEYLKRDVEWNYDQKQEPFVLDSLHFLQFFYYVSGSLTLEAIITGKVNPMAGKRWEVERLQINFPQLKMKIHAITHSSLEMTNQSQATISLIALIGTVLLLITTFLHLVYNCNYHRFRHNQRYQCLYIYKTIPPLLIETVRNYYSQLYTQYFQNKEKNPEIVVDSSNLNKNQITIQDNFHSTLSSKIKILGKDKFLAWIWPLLIFLFLNSINNLITYRMMTFVSQLDNFMTDVNNIVDSQNQLLQSYLDLKEAYLLHPKPEISQELMNNLLKVMNQNEVTFNHMVRFQSETLTKYDPEFYTEFYHLLSNNECEQIKQTLNQWQYSDCLQLSQNSTAGLNTITFMNSLQRKLYSALLELRNNTQQIFLQQGTSFFSNRGFKEIDMALTYNIKLFRKLLQRILQGYQKGMDYVNLMSNIVVILLIAPQLYALIMIVPLATSQKIKLSFLYGSILTLPPHVIRHVKHLPRMAKKILEFSQSQS